MIPDTVFTLAKAKAHLRVDHAEEDALITAMLDAAVAQCESITRKAWTKRHWTSLIDAADICEKGCGLFHARLSPANAKVYVGVPLPPPAPLPPELPATGYYYASRYGHTVLVIKQWGSMPTEGIVGAIAWSAEPINNPDDAGVPADVYAAAMLYLGDFYENREAQIVGIAATENPAAAMLLRSHVIELHV